MMKTQIVQFREWPCLLWYTAYANNQRTCIWLVDADTGEMILAATVNIPDWHLPENYVLIKDYSENHGILAVLEEAGIVNGTGRMVPSGWVEAHECRLLLSAEEYDLLPLERVTRDPLEVNDG